ncbi:MAG: hypothetical protein LBN99_02060 [Oscillospiraceae bacterium]|jgi:hypothetical protein|nr:hypothetical protein [Oscillospiraceae bacterium]
MADYSVTLPALDSTLDMLDFFREGFEEFTKYEQFHINSFKEKLYETLNSLNSEERDIRARIDSLYSRLSDYDGEGGGSPPAYIREELSDAQHRLERVHAAVEEASEIHRSFSAAENEFNDEWRRVIAQAGAIAEDGKREVAKYMRKIASVAGYDDSSAPMAVGANGTNVFNGASNYYIVAIDSAKYPETAAHIRSSIKKGHPAFLTVDRAGADENRSQSLRDRPARSVYDRDEYPPAMFEQGGYGADVQYVQGQDNRGAGGTTRWQLNNVPDGSTVRFRVI